MQLPIALNMGKFVKQARLPKGAYKKSLGEVLAPYAAASGQHLKEPEQVYHKAWCKHDFEKGIPCNCGVLE